MQEAAERGEIYDDRSSNYTPSHATPSPEKDDRHQSFGQAFSSLQIQQTEQTQSVDLKDNKKLEVQEITKPKAETVKI